MYRRGGVRLDALEHKAEGPGSPSGAFGVQGAGAGRGRGLAFSSEYWQLAMTWQKSSSHRSRLKPRVSVRNPSSDTRTKSDTASTFSLTSSVLCGANRGDGAQRACAQTEPRARPERPAEAAAPPGTSLQPHLEPAWSRPGAGLKPSCSPAWSPACSPACSRPAAGARLQASLSFLLHFTLKIDISTRVLLLTQMIHNPIGVLGHSLGLAGKGTRPPNSRQRNAFQAELPAPFGGGGVRWQLAEAGMVPAPPPQPQIAAPAPLQEPGVLQLKSRQGRGSG